ncbi:ribonuclease HIII, partial [Turicibacter sanguinis]|nr:ribonuclease HIII [Turicibacter sanguinis]
ESVHVAVAAASILARASFVKYMQIMSKKYQFELPKGAGAPVDIAGRNFVKLHGKETLQSLTKWHFANTNKILK